MKLSRRAKRIFTILVFFLMVNSSDVKVLQQDKSIELPISSAKEQPKENLVITVSGTNIIVQGRTVANIQEINAKGMLDGLKDELVYQGNKMSANRVITEGYPATLVADKNTPYKILKSIMATCTDANFTRISLAVSKQAKSESNLSKGV